MKGFLNYLVSAMALLVMTSCFFNNAKPAELFKKNSKECFISGDATWNFIDNEIVGIAKGASGFIMTKKSYKNFILELEFKPDSTVNSGIFIRCKNKELSMVDCYENNIWDLHPNQENRTGAVVNRSKPLIYVNTLDKWNTYKIKIEKNHLQTWVNGELITDLHDNDLSEGMIALQAAETGEIRFRNIKFQNLYSGTN
ncbi:DUF1080 domain-containing protein [Maribacter sp. HTCC2170]|uniref:3-keto-disaccharide hydrolase n=1 Tax=Maribacter sp. (strain HTCC2170 / KCCM 42371) TaxID=313603 RepID=UPI0003233C18|nr:DUF1080 domain-containing protein [Maribacter sp. HTCC2170]